MASCTAVTRRMLVVTTGGGESGHEGGSGVGGDGSDSGGEVESVERRRRVCRGYVEGTSCPEEAEPCVTEQTRMLQSEHEQEQPQRQDRLRMLSWR